MRSFQGKNEDDYMLFLGRKASGWGFIGVLVGIVISLLMDFPLAGLIFFSLAAGYIGLTGFWGVHALHKKVRKYRMRLPDIIYMLLKLLAVIPGVILGIFFYGAFQQFVLLLALDDGSGKPGLFQSVLILTPYLGPWYADKIDYTPYGSKQQRKY